MEKRYNFRIYPTRDQEIQIRKNFGCARFVYNHYLAKRIEAYRNGEGITGLNECCRDMTRLKRQEGYEWLNEADSNSLRYALSDLDAAYMSFFRAVRSGTAVSGYPK